MYSKVSIKGHDAVGSGDGRRWLGVWAVLLDPRPGVWWLLTPWPGVTLRWAGSVFPQVDSGMEVPSILGPYCLSQGLFCHQHSARWKGGHLEVLMAHSTLEKTCHVAIPTCPRSWGRGLGKCPWKGENESGRWSCLAPRGSTLQAVAEMAERNVRQDTEIHCELPDSKCAGPHGHCHIILPLTTPFSLTAL